MSNGNSQNSGSPGWSASFFMQTTDVARAVAAAVNSTPPSMVVSSKDDSSSQIRRLQRQVVKAFKGFSSPPEVKKRNYNPEILTSQKRQWASFHLQLLDQRPVKEPSRLFESMVVVGLHPNSDVQALQQQILARKSENSSKSRGSLNGCNLARVEPNFEPQVLFVYPPEKQLPLKYKDLLSFCFPGGTEVRAVERTPSMSELNEILIGQEHLKQSDLSFVFRLQVADDSTLYGCCVLVEEAVHQPSGLISMISEKQTFSKSFSRHILTTPRCYCILSRLPFFELHFAVLNSIFTEERLERLTKGMGMLDLDMVEGLNTEEELEEKPKDILAEYVPNGSMEVSEISTEGSTPRKIAEDASQLENQMLEGDFDLLSERIHNSVVSPNNSETGMLTPKGETRISDVQGITVDELATNKQPIERRLPEAVLPLLRYCQYESSESSISFQGSPCEDRNFRSDGDEAEMEEASSSGQDDHSDHNDILEWAKANNYGSLQIICEYYRLRCPARGTTVTFQPLEHLPSVEFHRPAETLLHGSSTIDIRSCSKSLELAEAHNSLLAEEEATALSVWTVACICGSLRLDNVLAIFTGALLEKQIVVVCSNLGILSALVLSIIPLIRPYHWQSLLVPVLPNDMLDFLDAPVPYVVGVKNKTTEVHSKSANVIVVDADKNQVVQSPRLPQLPQHKELISSLRPYHAKLVGEHYLARKRPVYECTEIQIEAAKGFLAELRSYLDLLCSNLRSHTITNVQSNDDKVSLLLKDSFIDSFPSRDRSFMKHFVDTQLFSVHSDLVLSFVQKE